MIKVLLFFLTLLTLLAGCSTGGVETASPTAAETVTEEAAATATATITAAPSPSAPAAAAASATPAPTETAVPATPTFTPTLLPGPLSGAALVEALRGGGYNLYFRHAATDPSPDDASPVVLADCATQRLLSSEGQAQAREIGEQFRRLGIPVGQVLASPFCRALDTARLAFDRVEIEPVLENLETVRDDAERETRTAGLRRLLSTPPEPGTNTVLAAHGVNINAAAQITIGEGEAAIFRPDGAGGFILVATVPWSDWAALEP